MSRYFIDRPIFAYVLAVMVVIAGLLSLRSLPIAQFPAIAPPAVSITANYPGADAQTLENTTTQIIEQQMKGIDHLRYFSSSSSSAGSVTITLTFEQGTDPDIAQVQVQNKLQAATPLLPQEVQRQGIIVAKATQNFLLFVGLYSENGKHDADDLADIVASRISDPLSRVTGVGDTQIFGSQYAMRIWVDPIKLNNYALTMADVTNAVTAQNAQVSAGQIGAQPAPKEQMLNATVSVSSRLTSPEQFAKIRLKSNTDGSIVRLGDVARVAIGAENYAFSAQWNGKPASGIGIKLAPGANALDTVTAVKERVNALAKEFPSDVKVIFPYDTSPFVRLSIEQVIETLVEAVVLVFLVMFLFLQNFRATLIPTIAVPVVLTGTFAVLAAFGYSINTLTLFGMVLAIGLLVDDAIVVVENVERLITTEHLSPREAARKSMDEITGALIGIAAVLSAVFLPMAFFGGSTGVIYRQFSITIVSAMILSVAVALILSPALTATLLKQKAREGEEGGWLDRKFPRVAHGLQRAKDGFNTRFEWTVEKYTSAVRTVVDRKWLFLLIYAGVVALLAVLFLRLPTGFLPTEDQGSALIQFRLPAGATQGRTMEVQRSVEQYFAQHEAKNVSVLFSVAGGGGGGTSGQNTGQGFINFVDWKDRKGKENSADAITGRASGAFRGLRDAQVFALVPPAIRGLGQSDGFTMELQNISGMPLEKFEAVRDQLLAKANADPMLASVRLTELPDIATLRVDLDQQKLSALGLTQQQVNSTLSTAWGGQYVNDFIDRGRVKRVFVQGDAPYRAEPEDLKQWFVRGSSGQMAPFSSFSTINWGVAPTTLSRFNGIPSYEFQGSAAPGYSSGDAMKRMTELAAEIPGTTIAWAGLSYQERLSGGQAPILYGLSILVVFLCLAALYESWSIPFAVLLVIPLGLIGAVAFVTLRGLTNDVYLQIGLLTTMGLAAKNAILMIEFAEQAEKQGKRVIDAALEAAKIRLRPILMTSFAFIFGVLPLAISTGAGANSRIAIGTAVIGGMLTATVLAIFYIPLFFVLVRRSVRNGLARLRGKPMSEHGAGHRPAPEGEAEKA